MSYSLTKSFNLTDSCPDVLSRNNNHLAVGAYNLDDSETQKKSGQIFVLDVENLEVVREYNEVGAIFDLIWVDDVIYWFVGFLLQDFEKKTTTGIYKYLSRLENILNILV